MVEAALAEPQTIKISSKRQITIPASLFKKKGFSEYALCTETEDGLLIQPIEVSDEDLSVDILRYLIEQGYEGDELIKHYQKIKPKLIKVTQSVERAARNYEEGRTLNWETLERETHEEFGL